MHYSIYKQEDIEVLLEIWSNDPENYEELYMYNCITKVLNVVETSLA